MMPYKFQFRNVHPEKPAVCFTFDDNFSRHSTYVAPAFSARGFRCTFYVNAGTEDFLSRHQARYLELLKQGFEIGSHGFVHDNLSELSPADALKNLRASARRIEELLHVYPATFAFPYHDYTDDTLSMARSVHLETRNTLADSKWFAIKTAIPLSDMLTAVEQCTEEKHPLVFSGHSVILTPEEADDDRLKSETGYNPILLDDLCALLDFIKTRSGHIQVLTFEQASLLAFIRRSCEIAGDTFFMTQDSLDPLKTFEIGMERLRELI